MGHRNIITFKDDDGKLIRPFSSIEEHDETIIENHNKLVKPEDRVYFMGDIAIGRQHIQKIGRMNGRKKLIKGNHDCVDSETECLTQSGWKKYTELGLTDKVLSIDPSTQLSEWMPIHSVIVKEATEVYTHSGISLDMSVTKNHRVMYLNSKNKIMYTNPEDMPSVYKIPTSCSSGKQDYTGLSDNDLRLLAWVYTDGTLTKYKEAPVSFVIYQSKPEGVKTIQNLLGTLGLKYSERTRLRDQKEILGKKIKTVREAHEFLISWESAERYLKYLGNKKTISEGLLNNLSTRQTEVFVRALMDGDGSWASNKKGTSGALHGSKCFLDSVQHLCVQHGIQAYLTVAREKDFRLNLSFGVCSQIHLSGGKHHGFKQQEYQGQVWCVTTPFTNFMVRRNGKAYFTGNCFKLKDYLPYFEDILAYRFYPEQKIIVSHIPIHTDNLYRFKWNVHGHTHANFIMNHPEEFDVDQKSYPDERYINLCLEKTDFKPVEFDDILERIGYAKNL